MEAMGDGIVTWHHGLIARWWVNFNVDGPEIEFFRGYVEAAQPGLDLACGTGRLLVPWVAGGLDVDGVDAAPDMIAACREAAARAGCRPDLYVQPMHLLDLPRRYGAIVMCGAFGIGGSRAQDLEALRRAHAHLRPGGVLVLDCETGEYDGERWRRWQPSPPDETEPPPDERRAAPDGCEYALRHRTVELDVEARSMRRELQAWQWRDGVLVAHETHDLTVNLYEPAEIVAALEAAGFAEVEVLGGYHGGPPTGDERFLVYVGRGPLT